MVRTISWHLVLVLQLLWIYSTIEAFPPPTSHINNLHYSSNGNSSNGNDNSNGNGTFSTSTTSPSSLAWMIPQRRRTVSNLFRNWNNNAGGTSATTTATTPATTATRTQDLSMSKSSSSSSSSDTTDTTTSNPVYRFLNHLYHGRTVPFSSWLQRRKVNKNGNNNNKNDDNNNNNQQVVSSQSLFSLKESIAAIVIYLLLGAVAYHSSSAVTVTPWSIVDALYFSVVTFTTVGYGDLYPTTLTGKLFTILFGLSGISILGAAIATIGSRLVETEQAMLQKVQDLSRKRISTTLLVLQQQKTQQQKTQQQQQQKNKKSNSSTTTTAKATTITNNNNNDEMERTIPLQIPHWFQSLSTLMQSSIPALSVLIVGGLLVGRLEGWPIWDSIYYAFITAGTLGYGDFAPRSRYGRMAAIVFIPLAVAAAGTVLSSIASTLLQRRQVRVHQALLSQPLNINRLLEMDTNHNGQVSREEYVAFMLQELQLVTSDQLQELRDQFDVLDVDGGGYLDPNDLQITVQEINKDRSE